MILRGFFNKQNLKIMEFKGTKGEVKVVTKDNERVIMFGNYNVAKMIGVCDSKEDKANESLLEASPKLLEALQETDKDLCVLWGQIKHLEETNPLAEGLSDLVHKWRKRNSEAINKALK